MIYVYYAFYACVLLCVFLLAHNTQQFGLLLFSLCNNRITQPEVKSLQQYVESRRRILDDNIDVQSDSDLNNDALANTQLEEKRRILKNTTILFDNLLKPKIVSGYGGY